MDMSSLAGIPGTISPEARRIRWRRLDDLPTGGPEPARVYEADVADGSLLATVGREPAGRGGRLLWHVAVSHRDRQGKPDRCPSWDELKHAAYRLLQADVVLVLIFPRRSAAAEGGYVDIAQTCLHLWESEKEIDR